MCKLFPRTAVAFIPLLAACTIIRYLQLVYAVDFNTGFYSRDAGILSSLLYVVFAAGFVLMFFAALWDKKGRGEFFTKKLGRIKAPDVKLTGMMFLLAAVTIIYTLVSGAFVGLGLVEFFCGFVGFLLPGLIFFIKKRIISVSGFSMLFISFYYTLKMISLFMSNLVLTKMSDYLIRLLFCIFAIVFYLAAGRIFSRNESRFTRLRFVVCGYAALGLALSEMIAKIAYWLSAPASVQQDLSAAGAVFVMPDALSAAECIVILSLMMLFLKRPSNGGEKIDN